METQTEDNQEEKHLEIPLMTAHVGIFHAVDV